MKYSNYYMKPFTIHNIHYFVKIKGIL